MTGKKTVKSRFLELLEQNKGVTLSGEKIAGELNCTRAAVCKAAKALREEGYDIEAGSNRGYRLSPDSNLLAEEGIRPLLHKPEVYLKVYPETDSTNGKAKQAAMAGKAEAGSAVLAGSQSAGRGRRGRDFYSPSDTGLYLSVVLKPRGSLQESLLLTTQAAVAVHRAVRLVTGISLDIKWVNDLYFQGKKVCGILTEAVTDFESGEIQFAVVGIGLNLYVPEEGFPPELEGIAGALYTAREEAENVSRNRLAAEIINCLLEETKEPVLPPDYVKYNMVPGRWVRILDGKESRRVLALGICSDGRLEVQEEDGIRRILSYGDISLNV